MPDEWPRKAEKLLEEAREVPPDERAAFLRERCEEKALRQEVLSLLEAHRESAGFFEALAEEVVAPAFGDLRAEAEKAGPPREQRAADPLGLEGRTVGRYVVEGHLGGGGMGVVYRARDPELDRQVALKFLPPHLAATEEAERRFVREAKAAAALEHPNIATIHEIGEAEDGRRFIAMAYYEGETLKEKLRREGPLPVGEALTYAEQVGEALAEAHEAGIVHRDVKPANVMVTEAGDVKLLDFGLAKAAAETRLTEPGRPMGTAAYMSPEQAEGKEVDGRTDLWALGALLYEMLAGVRPFQGGRPAAVIQGILHEAPMPLGERRKEVSSALEQVVRRCLRKDLEERYTSAEALLGDLRAVRSETAAAEASQQKRRPGRLEEETSAGGPLARVRRFVRELRRRRVLRVAAVYAGTGFVILQLGEILVEPFGLPGWTLRFMTFLLALGFPLAVGLAWTFDVTEEGVVRTGRRDALADASNRSAFTSNGLVVGLIILALGLFLYPRVFSSGEEPAGQSPPPTSGPTEVKERSIAVLPFEDRGTEREALGTGLTGAIIAELSSSEKLVVVSQSSVTPYRDTTLSPSQIADHLRVEYVLDGTVQQAGGRIQVTAELIEAKTGRALWAQTSDRPMSGIFEVQSDLALQVAKEVGAALTPEARSQIAERPTSNVAAYRLYLRAQELLSEVEGDPDRTEIESAIELLRQALRLDSTFARAQAALASAFVERSELIADTRWLDSARTAARRALQIEPDLAEAHYRLGEVYRETGKTEAAKQALNRTLERKPGHAWAMYNLGYIAQVHEPRWADALHWYWQALPRLPEHPYPRSAIGFVMLGFGEDSASVAWRRRAVELGSPVLTNYLLLVDLARGDLEAAREHLERYQAWDAGHPRVLQWTGLLAQLTGDPTRALRFYRRAQHESSGPATLMGVPAEVRRAQLLQRKGEARRADSLLQASIRRSQEGVGENELSGPRLQLAAAYQVAGDSAAARKWLEAAYRAGFRKHRAHRKDPVWRGVGYAQSVFDRMAEDLAAQKADAKAWARVENVEWPPMPGDHPALELPPVAGDSAGASSPPTDRPGAAFSEQ